jgi:DNA-binding transcriptional MerR regulator
MEPPASSEFDRLERDHPEGLSAQSIVEFFESRGVPLAEATFRKYVQLGLLPRSRRVGRKGKHRGSHGLYPPATARAVGTIKELMAAGKTLEEIQREVGHRSAVAQIERALDEVRDQLARDLGALAFPAGRERALRSQLQGAHRGAREAVRKLGGIANEIAAEGRPKADDGSEEE